MDGGRGWDNTSYAFFISCARRRFYQELERFHWIFPPRHAAPRLYYMAGNHDIGISKTSMLIGSFISSYSARV